MEKSTTLVAQPIPSGTQTASNELCGDVTGMMFYGMASTALAVVGIAAATSVMDWKVAALAVVPVMLPLAYGLVQSTRRFARQVKALQTTPVAG